MLWYMLWCMLWCILLPIISVDLNEGFSHFNFHYLYIHLDSPNKKFHSGALVCPQIQEPSSAADLKSHLKNQVGPTPVTYYHFPLYISNMEKKAVKKKKGQILTYNSCSSPQPPVPLHVAGSRLAIFKKKSFMKKC